MYVIYYLPLTYLFVYLFIWNEDVILTFDLPFNSTRSIEFKELVGNFQDRLVCCSVLNFRFLKKTTLVLQTLCARPVIPMFGLREFQTPLLLLFLKQWEDPFGCQVCLLTTKCLFIRGIKKKLNGKFPYGQILWLRNWGTVGVTYLDLETPTPDTPT